MRRRYPFSLSFVFVNFFERANLTALSNISLCNDSFNLQVYGVDTPFIVSSGSSERTIGSGTFIYLII